MRHRRRPLALGAAVTLLAGLLMFGTAPQASACAPLTKQDVFRGLRAGTMETIPLRTLNIELKFPRTVAIGQVAKIQATVTRPAKEDPAGQGIPMERPYVEPAPDVIVGIGLSIGRVFLPGAAITDAEGKATVNIKMEPWTPAGKPVDVSSYAWRIVHQNQCLTIQEDGYTAAQGAFKTSR